MSNERLSWSRSSAPGTSGAREQRQESTRNSRTSLYGNATGDASAQAVRTGIGAQQNTSIARGCGIKGELYFTGVAELNCRIEGEIASEGDLVIGESAQVLGSIRAQRLMVFGAVSGDITCSERVELHAGARVAGSICSPRVVMHDGVHFEGDCAMPSSGGTHERLDETEVSEENSSWHSPEIDDSDADSSEEDLLANE